MSDVRIGPYGNGGYEVVEDKLSVAIFRAPLTVVRDPDTGRVTDTTPSPEASDRALARARRFAASGSLMAAAKALVDRDLTYDGNKLVIECANHADAIRQVADLRAALAKAEGKS